MPAKGVLKACRICIAGELGPGRDAGRVKKWVEANGGTFSSSVDEKVTHMLCSEEHFKSQKSAISRYSNMSYISADNCSTAKQTNKYESIKTVTFDWLEDSLTKKLKKREAPYLLAKTKETRAKKRETRQKNLLFAGNFLPPVSSLVIYSFYKILLAVASLSLGQPQGLSKGAPSSRSRNSSVKELFQLF